MMNKEEKGRLRKLALLKRDNIAPLEREQGSDEAAEKLLALPELSRAGVIMCYRSFRSELITDKIVENLLQQGKTLCFPLCEKGGIMYAYSPNESSAWEKSPMGIMEPDRKNSRLIAPEDIDIVLCPMLAFDKEKHRLGYGGGYYDRYLPGCKKAIKIGIAFEKQRIEDVPTDIHDQNMDIIVTDENLYA